MHKYADFLQSMVVGHQNRTITQYYPMARLILAITEIIHVRQGTNNQRKVFYSAIQAQYGQKLLHQTVVVSNFS